MPIRFRCQHCKQNLGISRSKAGEVVDCPTCGRSIEVPQRDGQAKDARRPQMNFRDPAVAKAMREIQLLGDDIAKPKTDSSRESSSEMESAVESMPIMLSEPEVAPPPALEIAPAPTNQPTSEPTGLPPEQTPERQRNELEELAREADEHAGHSSSVGQPSQLSIPLIGGLVLAFGLMMGLGMGYFFSDSDSGESKGDGETSSQAEEQPNQAPPTPVPDSDETNVTVVSGVITYDPENATTRPDSQSLVILLATSRLGEVMIPGESLWEPVESSDFQVAAAALELIGGQAALTDSEGKFSLTVPSSEPHHFLVVSRHTMREDSAIDAALNDVLKEYFEQPRQLLGKRAYHVEMLTLSGEKQLSIRHRFER
ncbi:hypothetical protein [Thalassoroseus pseudoceratinae]|uniref:hypothetical protein n=1 Tax=Thalassoroseus pseudoceratinae TaxID=2713176 RepID=UPI0014202854|nr:hypothetical protein [Thalassoroseus pseudoceratinae]